MRIRQMVAEVDEQHQRAMTTIEDDIARVHLSNDDEAVAGSRRNFVQRLGVTGAVALGAATLPATLLGGVAAAQDTSDTTDKAETPGATDSPDAGDTPVASDEGPTPLSADATDAGDGPTQLAAPDEDAGISDSDLKILEFSQGLELALVAAYGLAIETRLLDSAHAEMCHTFSRHHTDHAKAFATVAGKENTVTEARADVIDALKPTIAAASSADALLATLREMEESAAATYLEAIGKIEAWWAAGPTSKVLPIEAQHAAVLGQATGLTEDKWLPAVQKTTSVFPQFKSAS